MHQLGLKLHNNLIHSGASFFPSPTKKKNFIKIFVNKQAFVLHSHSKLRFSRTFTSAKKNFSIEFGARCILLGANTSFAVYFSAELRARILGPSDIFVKSGSEIIMTCVIQQGPHDLGTVFWYKGRWWLPDW